jgi:hypothetical protein
MLALLLALACAAPGTATPEDFATAYAEAYCEWDASCSDREWTYDDCIAEVQPIATEKYTSDACPAWEPESAALCIATYTDALEECGTPDATACTTMPCAE